MLRSPANNSCASCLGQGFVASTAITASCGCEFHPACLGMLLQTSAFFCPQCNNWFDGVWMAQFRVPLTETMKAEFNQMSGILRADYRDFPRDESEIHRGRPPSPPVAEEPMVPSPPNSPRHPPGVVGEASTKKATPPWPAMVARSTPRAESTSAGVAHPKPRTRGQYIDVFLREGITYTLAAFCFNWRVHSFADGLQTPPGISKIKLTQQQDLLPRRSQQVNYPDARLHLMLRLMTRLFQWTFAVCAIRKTTYTSWRTSTTSIDS